MRNKVKKFLKGDRIRRKGNGKMLISNGDIYCFFPVPVCIQYTEGKTRKKFMDDEKRCREMNEMVLE